MSDISAFKYSNQATNTVIVYQLDAGAIATWADRMAACDGSLKVVRLPSFSRVLALFTNQITATMALQSVNNEARAMFGPNMLADTQADHLELPDKGKLLFISPPPSPPAGWESIPEDAPNTRTHFEDGLSKKLERALLKLDVHAPAAASANGAHSLPSPALDIPASPFASSVATAAAARAGARKVVLQEGSGTVPGISLECVESPAPSYASSDFKIPKTALPNLN